MRGNFLLDALWYGPARRQELECGRLFLSRISGVGDLTLSVKGRTALFVQYDVSLSGNLTIELGPEGAHKLVNASTRPARVLVVSTMVEPDIGEYPDSGKVGLFAGAAPGAPTPEGTLEGFYRLDEVDYFDGEPPPEARD